MWKQAAILVVCLVFRTAQSQSCWNPINTDQCKDLMTDSLNDANVQSQLQSCPCLSFCAGVLVPSSPSMGCQDTFYGNAKCGGLKGEIVRGCTAAHLTEPAESNGADFQPRDQPSQNRPENQVEVTTQPQDQTPQDPKPAENSPADTSNPFNTGWGSGPSRTNTYTVEETPQGTTTSSTTGTSSTTSSTTGTSSTTTSSTTQSGQQGTTITGTSSTTSTTQGAGGNGFRNFQVTASFNQPTGNQQTGTGTSSTGTTSTSTSSTGTSTTSTSSTGTTSTGTSSTGTSTTSTSSTGTTSTSTSSTGTSTTSTTPGNWVVSVKRDPESTPTTSSTTSSATTSTTGGARGTTVTVTFGQRNNDPPPVGGATSQTNGSSGGATFTVTPPRVASSATNGQSSVRSREQVNSGSSSLATTVVWCGATLLALCL